MSAMNYDRHLLPYESVLLFSFIDPLDIKIRLHKAFKEAHIRCTDIEGQNQSGTVALSIAVEISDAAGIEDRDLRINRCTPDVELDRVTRDGCISHHQALSVADVVHKLEVFPCDVSRDSLPFFSL